MRSPNQAKHPEARIDHGTPPCYVGSPLCDSLDGWKDTESMSDKEHKYYEYTDCLDNVGQSRNHGPIVPILRVSWLRSNAAVLPSIRLTIPTSDMI